MKLRYRPQMVLRFKTEGRVLASTLKYWAHSGSMVNYTRYKYCRRCIIAKVHFNRSNWYANP